MRGAKAALPGRVAAPTGLERRARRVFGRARKRRYALAMHNTTYIPGKDAALESTIQTLQSRLQQLGFHVEERSWLNPVDGIWSVHIRDRDCPLLFSNGKGASRLACLASALGEFV